MTLMLIPTAFAITNGMPADDLPEVVVVEVGDQFP